MPIQTFERPTLSEDELLQISKDDLAIKWKQLDAYANHLETNSNELETKLKAKLFEVTKLKNIMLMNYVSSKTLESTSQFQDSSSSFSPSSSSANLSASILPNTASQATKTKLAFVDPAVNAIIIQLKKELEETKKSNQDLKNELSSTKFSPESLLCKRLMFKCRKLLKENEELGKTISSGAVAQLEHDLAYHKKLLNETYENEQNISSFLIEIDNEMDAMQATILHLQDKLNSYSNLDKKEIEVPEPASNGTQNMETNAQI